MISRRTVFVIGAGAHVPYGFSTGGGLIDVLRGKDVRTLMGNAGRRFTNAQSAAFTEVMNGNLLPSIDAMLEHRAEFVSIGKCAMAAVLYSQETTAAPCSFDQDWMQLVFEGMSAGAATLDQFSTNPVSFVTYNYDRYMEHRFIRGLVARYNVNPQVAWAGIQHMFIHVYGSLGALPEQAAPGTTDPQAIALGAPDTPDVYTFGLALPIIEAGIRIVHEGDNPPPTFEQAFGKFQEAQQALFLGFGFGDKNLERLRTREIPQEVRVYCMTYGMTPAEVDQQVFPAFPRHPLNDLREARTTDRITIKQYLRDRIQVIR